MAKHGRKINWYSKLLTFKCYIEQVYLNLFSAIKRGTVFLNDHVDEYLYEFSVLQKHYVTGLMRSNGYGFVALNI